MRNLGSTSSVSILYSKVPFIEKYVLFVPCPYFVQIIPFPLCVQVQQYSTVQYKIALLLKFRRLRA